MIRFDSFSLDFGPGFGQYGWRFAAIFGDGTLARKEMHGNRRIGSSPACRYSAVETVTLGMWLQFLFGGREAILQFAHCPHALWLGLLFVLSTGFAREYDGADLRSEPWHLALPLVASLGTSLILWSLVYLAAIRRGLEQMGFWAGYRTLLTFYWMTAPLAWIYAIPVERFMSPADATATNFYFLAVVAAWRVLLITRSLAVWLNASFFALFFLVALFADSVAALLALASPMPIFNVMGGIRHSAVDRVILDVLMNTQILGVISWPVWLVGALVILVRKSPWSVATISLSMSALPSRCGRCPSRWWLLESQYSRWVSLNNGMPRRPQHFYTLKRSIRPYVTWQNLSGPTFRRFGIHLRASDTARILQTSLPCWSRSPSRQAPNGCPRST